MKKKNIFDSVAGPLLFAHRGYSSRAPENTLAAFDLARREGIPGLELDVRLCATGEIMVFHDDNLNRICRVDKTIEEMSFDDLRTLDAGVWKDRAFKGEKIPLLSELFELAGNEMLYDIEIKNRSRITGPLEKALVELIRHHGLENRCLVSSFNPCCIRTFGKLSPKTPTAVIYSIDPGMPWYLRRGEGRFIAGCSLLKPNKNMVSRGYVFRHTTLGGYPILPWTVDDPSEAKKLLEDGAAGIISNDPGPLKPLFGL